MRSFLSKSRYFCTTNCDYLNILFRYIINNDIREKFYIIQQSFIGAEYNPLIIAYNYQNWIFLLCPWVSTFGRQKNSY